jgi:1-phosphofructokinase
MIETLTLNPSIDVIASMKEAREGEINRVEEEVCLAGGKGINVSIVLSRLGLSSTALGFLAGFSGKEIERQLKKQGILTDFIEVPGMSRINFKVKAQKETDFNGPGPEISEEAEQALFHKLDGLREGDILVLSGSSPASLGNTIYADIMKHLKKKKVRIVLDADGDLLKNSLKYHPFFVKPNAQELGRLYGVKIDTQLRAMEYARKLHGKTHGHVLVSLGGNGAVYIAKDGREFYASAPVGNVVNTTGAGDSMVAGFLYAWLQNGDCTHAFHYALCTGSATAFHAGLCTKEETAALFEETKERLKWMK